MREKLKHELEKIKAEGLYRSLPDIDEGAGKYIISGGKCLLNLASNNYLGISKKKELVDESAAALKAFGCSSGASRVVTGNFSLYNSLEKEMADFKETESCLVLNTGFMANLAVITSLAGRHTAVFSDKLNHASIIDGIKLSGARHIRYRHNDMAHLAELLEQYKDTEEKIIVTDSVFSMDGDRADLAEIVRLAEKYGALTVADEAHATGILGGGRGLARELGLEKRIDVHMGTFSKALGSFGAYIAGDAEIIDYIRNKGRAFIFTTSLPPAVIGANLGALKWLRDNPSCGHRLLEKAKTVRIALNEAGFDTADSSTQIIPVIIGDNFKVQQAGTLLEEAGIKAGVIRPPTVPDGTARLRLSVRLDLNDEEVQHVISSVRRLKNA
ncbi:8-amino-7-oxononanoate synthase [Geovibrio thiophilus]|uniref:8-amino-7-oxononanoate synthase n=1 Tax=Geovibrio thiophilus TaxID=139438 RepID=A0A3R5XWL4_9BACT|nr:8-amino-7-oxononanoate synthase [Geovibrio thiophilus]QAR32947.1 8-amino-7-oxononanoate synthase [Geovibrio thiophilus]